MRRIAQSALFACAALAVPASARADSIDNLSRKLTTLESQAIDLERLVRPPVPSGQGDPEAIERRLVQAQVAYGVGRYADASLLLYDIVEKYPTARSYPEALFYLADSLFLKGDNQLARGYFHKIIDQGGPSYPHYQQALERCIEISLRLQDATRVNDYLAKLDAIPKESTYYFQAQYFAGVALVAKGELGEAAKVYHALIRLAPKNETDEKVVELSHLALGRLHYERDQPTDAIDHYLIISRRSPYFDEALFEVAWVYVKAKQFDKALRALELLALANPRSARLPDVRILEGNLRIRKAQTVAVAQGNSAEEYAKATQVFEQTRDTYEKPKTDLDQILAAHADPRVFFDQITGRAGATLETQIELPEVVVNWLREEAEVSRAVGVSTDLDEIRASLDESQALIARLEHAVSSPSRVAIFPQLAEKRGRAQEIGQAAFVARQDLSSQLAAMTDRVATQGERGRIAELREQRRALAARLAAMPGSGDSYYERVRKARAAYVEADKKAQQLEVQIISLEAQMVALDKYYADMEAQSGRLAVSRADYDKGAADARQLIAELRKQLEAIRNDIVLASDEAGISEQLAAEEKEVRGELAAAMDAEEQAMRPVVNRMGGGDRARAERITQLIAQAERVEAQTDKVIAKIEGFVDEQLSEAKAIIVEEKGNVAGYQQQLSSYDGESVEVGSEVVGASFAAVSKKFYEIGVRADVGLLDVSWAQKEQAQGAVEKLRLDFANEKNTMEGELRSIRQAGDEEPAGAGKEGGDAQ